jgi:hypothetical protein
LNKQDDKAPDKAPEKAPKIKNPQEKPYSPTGAPASDNMEYSAIFSALGVQPNEKRIAFLRELLGK